MIAPNLNPNVATHAPGWAAFFKSKFPLSSAFSATSWSGTYGGEFKF